MPKGVPWRSRWTSCAGFLTDENLSPEERGLIRRASDTVDARSVIEELVELRIRRGLAEVYDSLGDPDAPVPQVVLARGDDPDELSSTLERPPGEEVPRTLEKQGEVRRTVSTDADAIDPDVTLARTLGQSRAGRALSLSLGLDGGSVLDVESIEAHGRDVLVVTDRSGAEDIEATMRPGTGTVIRSEDVAGTELRWTSKRLKVVELGGTLDALERVMLWSMPTEEREGLLRRAVRGTLEGSILGKKYLVEKRMGAGGFGTVYRAKDTILGARVAVKVLNPRIARSREALEGFLAEAQRLTTLDHPNIVRWITFDRTSDGLHYFVMEFLDGEELYELMKREGALDPERVGEILLNVLGALRKAHRIEKGASLLHLDLKPQNVFVLPKNETDPERAKVIDFGISRFSRDQGMNEVGDPLSKNLHETDAKLTSGHGGSTTVARVAGGTVLYASPEQCKHLIGDEDIVELDGRTDIYSMGVMAFEMLTGSYPYPKAKSQFEAIKNHMAVEPYRVLEMRKDVPRKLAAFVDKCLEKDRDDRWASADEAYRELDRILHPVGSRKVMIGVIAAALLAVVTAVLWPRATPVEEVSAELVSPAGTRIRLAGETVYLRGGARVRIFPDSPEGSPEELKLVDANDLDSESEEPLAGFRAVWDPRDESIDLSYDLDGSSPPDSQKVKLTWESGDQRFQSSSFVLRGVPAFEWVGSEGDATPWRIEEAKGDEWLGTGKPILVDRPINLVVSLRDHEFIDEVKADCTREGWEEPAELELGPVRGGGFRLRLDAAAKRLELEEVEEAQVSIVLRARDKLGETHSLSEPIPVRLTVKETTLKVSHVSYGGKRASFRLPDYFVPKPSEGGASLEICGNVSRTGAPTDLEVRDATGGSPGVVVASGSAKEDGSFVLQVNLREDELTSRVFVVSADDSEHILAVGGTGTTDSTTVSIRLRSVPGFVPKLLKDSTRVAVWSPSGDDVPGGGEQLVRPGANGLQVSLEEESPDDWLVRLSGDTTRYAIAGNASPARFEGLTLPGEDGAKIGFELDYFAMSDLADWKGFSPGDEPSEAMLARLVEITPLDQGELTIRVDGELALLVQNPLLEFESDGAVVLDEEAMKDLEGQSFIFSASDGAPLEGVQYSIGGSRKTALADKDGRIELNAAAVLGSLKDGSYQLKVEARDVLGNNDRTSDAALRFEVNRRPPVVTIEWPSKSKPWEPSNDAYRVRVKVVDGNVLDRVSAEIRFIRDGEDVDSARLPLEASTPIEASADTPGKQFSPAGYYSAKVPIDRTLEDSEVSITVYAEDTLGRKGSSNRSVLLKDVQEFYSASHVVASGRDDTNMVLFQPRTYTFNEYEPKDMVSQLERKGVHYVDGRAASQDYRELVGGFSRPKFEVSEGQFPPFYLDEHEVSQRQFLRFLEDEAGYLEPVGWRSLGLEGTVQVARHQFLLGRLKGQDPGFPYDPDFPMFDVNWAEAWLYARWAKKRLPTLLEWEYAVRGNQKRLFAATSGKQRSVPVDEGESVSGKVYAYVGYDRPSKVRGDDAWLSPELVWHLCGNVAEWTGSRRVPTRDCDLESLLSPESVDLSSGSAPSFWLVGTDHLPRRTGGFGVPKIKPHDFMVVRYDKWNSDFSRLQFPFRVGFRCAIDASQTRAD